MPKCPKSGGPQACPECSPENFCFLTEHGNSGDDPSAKTMCPKCSPQNFCTDAKHGHSEESPAHMSACKKCSYGYFERQGRGGQGQTTTTTTTDLERQTSSTRKTNSYNSAKKGFKSKYKKICGGARQGQIQIQEDIRSLLQFECPKSRSPACPECSPLNFCFLGTRQLERCSIS